MNRAIRQELNGLWNNNAFGNMADFDADDLQNEARQLCKHWSAQGWTIHAWVEDVAEFLAEKIAEVSK